MRGIQFDDPVDGKIKDFFKGEGKPEPGTELKGFPEEPKAEEPKAEEPKAEEPKKEEPKAEEPKAEEPKEELKEEEPKAEESEKGSEEGSEEKTVEWKFDLESFNNTFKTEYDSEDTFKKDISEVKTLREEKAELEGKLDGVEEKYEEAKKAINPRQYFVSDDEYKRQLILQKYGTEVNPAALNMIVSTDLSKLTDFDTLVLAEMVNNPGIKGGESGAKELIYDQLGIDPETDPKEWETLQHNKIAKEAAKLRITLSKLQDVEIPEIADFEAETKAQAEQQKQETQELTTKWDGAADKLLSGIKELALQDDVDGKKTDVFAYVVPDTFKAEVKSELIEFMAENGAAPTQENIQEALEYVHERFVRENFKDMMLAYGKDVETKVTEEMDKKYANPKPHGDQQKPVEDVDKEDAEFIAWAKEGVAPSKEGGPLFPK